MNRALVVGIGDYGRLGQPLPGCANDLAGWRDLVAPALAIGGENLRVRADAQATRSVLLDDLHWLLSDASEGDQRFFFFAGHGARFRRRDPATGAVDDILDETLVTYPEASEDRETFMLFDSDLARLIDRSELPASVRLTLIVDACHSGGISRRPVIDDIASEGPLIRSMAFPDDEEEGALARELKLDKPRIRRFGDLLSVAVPRTFGIPRSINVSRVIVAAARPEQRAWDDRMPNGKRHGIFSYHALNEIAAQPRISFDALIAAVTPHIAASFPQHPMLLGDTGRFSGQIFN